MQSIVTPLQAVITSPTRRIKIAVLASWLKQADLSTVYAQVGVSEVGGADLVQGQSAVITNADLFSYIDESAYVMRFDYDRRVDEPRGGASYAIGNIVLDNITRRFTQNSDDTIGTALESRRPIKASIGFIAESAVRSVQVIVGLTSDRPRENRGERTVEVDLFDYITFIENQTLAAAIYNDMRSDQIIEDILSDLGFGTSQYDLDTGINTIPFAWFDKGKSAGRRIREICEAEEAHFYQDENGILRFENRNHYTNFPHQTVQHNIHPGDIMSDETDDSTPIINRAIVIARPREVDSSPSVIWSSSELPIEIGAGQTVTIWPQFFDSEAGENVLPINEITTPVEDTDYDANSQSDGGGTDKSSQVGIVVTNFVESAKVEITNNDAATIYITLLQLRGKAARVTQAIQKISEDTDSINKYEAQEYVLRNDLIQDPDIAESIADNLKNRYKEPMARRVITIPGIPHLQLKDLIRVTDPAPDNLMPNPSFEGGTDNWSLTVGGSGAAALSQARDIAVPDGFYLGKVAVTHL